MTSVLTKGLEKKGSPLSLVFLYLSPLHPMMNPQRGRGGSALMPSAVSGLLSVPLASHSTFNPFFLPRVSLLIFCVNTENELFTFHHFS